MKIVPIFPKDKPVILSAHYADEKLNEFRRVFELWSDVEYLEAFFEANKVDLCSGYFGRQSIEAAVKRIWYDASILEEQLIALAELGQVDPYNTLQTLFLPLRNEQGFTSLQKSKAKIHPIKKNNWLRLYAIRIAPNLYVITGGAIKLTRLMQDREHTQKELVKLDKVKTYLLDQGLCHESDFQFLEL